MELERVQQMTVEEFLDFAARSEYRYEYINGEPIKMSGGKLNHFLIIANIMNAIANLLADRDFDVLGSGMLVRVGEATLVAPDVSVISGQPETEADTHILLNPILVAEVTSPATVDLDRGAKLEYYFDVPSIESYLIVDQHRVLVEMHSRGAAGWRKSVFESFDDEVPLEMLRCALPLRDIYQSIDFEPETASNAN